MIQKVVPLLLAVLAIVWLANLSSQAQQLPSPKAPEFEAWRTTIKQTPLPDKGCFKASYPSTEWQQVTCTIAPNRPYLPARGPKPPTVGNGTDFTGVVSGLLSQAEGSFPFSSGISISHSYSLQLNSNFFKTPACTSCSGWQQFIYSSSSPSAIYMQYWLLGYGTSCPSGWTESSGSCYKNSSATDISGQPSTNLPYIYLTGKASGGTDTVLMDSPSGDISAVGADSVLDLEQGWNSAEFNVFGNGNGSEVSFSSDAALVVQISLVNGTTNVPSYSTGGFTGETNNLTLIGTAPCRYGGTTPMIQFMESDAGGSASCGSTGIETNIAQAPSHTNIVYTRGGGQPPAFVSWSMTLVDGTPGADIHYVISYCQEQEGGSQPPGEFVFEETGSNENCFPSGLMYATAPGYFTSPEVSIIF
jgi:hypothetical protein